ncbi:hypothetical protein ACMHYB_53645 [Sorangium sp. So ce1128]
MMPRLHRVLGMGCAAAAALAAGQAIAMPPPPGPAAQASPASRPPAASPAASPPATPPSGAPGAAAPAPLPAGSSAPLPPAPPGGPAGAPPPPASPPGDASAPPPPAAPPAGAWDAPPPGYPPPPPGWTWSPVPWQPEATAGGEQPATKTVWYGWQHLLVALGSLVLLPVGASESEALVWVGVGGFALGGPVTHWANGNVGKGFLSLGLNAGGAFGGAMIGLAIGSSSDDGGWAALGGFVFGGGLGLLVANIIDIAALEYEERGTAESYDYIRVRSPRLRLAPQVGLAPGGATFGLGGAF